jgi:hypothetical protein
MFNDNKQRNQLIVNKNNSKSKENIANYNNINEKSPMNSKIKKNMNNMNNKVFTPKRTRMESH